MVDILTGEVEDRERTPEERGVDPAASTAANGNTVVVVDGSNGELKPADVWRQETLFSDSDVVVCQLETPRETEIGRAHV